MSINNIDNVQGAACEVMPMETEKMVTDWSGLSTLALWDIPDTWVRHDWEGHAFHSPSNLVPVQFKSICVSDGVVYADWFPGDLSVHVM